MPTRRIRAHLNPLRLSLQHLPLPTLALPAGVPIDVELGSAEAQLLIELAEEQRPRGDRSAPSRLFFGLELREEKVRRANREAERRGLKGVVTSLFANASTDIPRLFPAASVARFFVYFPDPWFKTWQHKRRIVEPALVEAVYAALVPGGEVHLATDIFALGLEGLALLEEQAERGRFVNLAGGPWRFLKQSPVTARSRRERQCEAEGKHVWRVGFRKI